MTSQRGIAAGVVALLLCSPAHARSVREAAAAVVAQHPLVRAEKERLDATYAEKTTARVLLPSHPEIAFSMADRRLWQPGPGAPTPALNFYLSLSQKIEIAGQRGARMAVADAQGRAQLKRVALIELRIAADAANAAVMLAAARERAALGEALREMSARLFESADARLAEALISEVDAALLSAEAARIAFDADEMVLAKAAAAARWRAIAGGGDLDALPAVPPALAIDVPAVEARALETRADLAALRAEHEAQLAIREQIERERVPNVTLSAFLQSDGFNERVLGAGIALPIVLPSPLGPSRRGELDAAAAKARAIEAEVVARERQVREEVETAAAVLAARERQAAQYSAQRVERARAHVQALVEALRTSKVPVREGLLSLRALIDLIDRGTIARAAVFEARLELARAAALPIEEVLP